MTRRRWSWTGSFDREHFRRDSCRHAGIFPLPPECLPSFFFFPLVSLPFFWIARRTFSLFCNLKPTDGKGFTKFHRLEPGCRRVIISREKCYPNFGKPALPKANSSSSDGRRGGRGETKGKKKEINYRRRYKRYALNPRTWLLFVLGNESRYHNCDNRASAKRFIETSPGNRQKKFRHGGCTLWDFVVKRWANTTLSRSFCNSCTGIFDATPRSNTMNFIEWLVEWHVNDAFMMAYSKRIEWIPPKKSRQIIVAIASCEISSKKIDSFFFFFTLHSKSDESKCFNASVFNRL